MEKKTRGFYVAAALLIALFFAACNSRSSLDIDYDDGGPGNGGGNRPGGGGSGSPGSPPITSTEITWTATRQLVRMVHHTSILTLARL